MHPFTSRADIPPCEHPFDSAHEATILRLNMIMGAVKRIQGEHNTAITI
jgi:hypothetical protein